MQIISHLDPSSNCFKEIHGLTGADNAILLKVTEESQHKAVILRVERSIRIVGYNEKRTDPRIDWQRTCPVLTYTAPGPETERYDMCDMGVTLLVQPFPFDCFDHQPAPSNTAREQKREKVMSLVRETLRERAPQMHEKLQKQSTRVIFVDEHMRRVIEYGVYSSK